MFSLICAWTNVWRNNRDAGDLRHHCTHYQVTIMFLLFLKRYLQQSLLKLNFHLQMTNNNEQDSSTSATEISQSCAKATKPSCFPYSLQWCHNGHDGVSNHQHHHCLLNRLIRRRSKKIWKLCITGLCVVNSPVTGDFPTHMASNTENVSISCLRPRWQPLSIPPRHRMSSYFKDTRSIPRGALSEVLPDVCLK